MNEGCPVVLAVYMGERASAVITCSSLKALCTPQPRFGRETVT
jgi:hypothetical protein